MRAVSLAALVVVALACRRAPPLPIAPALQRSPSPADPAQIPPPVMVSDSDAEMNAAMAEGQKTLPRFLETLRHPPAGTEGYAIKATFRAGTQVEHMWLQEPRAVGDKFEGILANDPAYLDGYRNGDSLSVARAQIVDWSYIDKGTLVGGYTLRVMFKRTPPAEREALQRELGYRF